MDFIADHPSLIKLIIVITVVVLLGWRQFRREYQARSAALSDKPTPLFSKNFVSVLDLSREFLFAAHTVEQHINDYYTEEPLRENFHSSVSYFFALNSYHSRKGNKLEAKNSLKQVLSSPEVDSRSVLVAWKALRGLGQFPNGGTTRQPLGVVIEMPVDKKSTSPKAMDMIAAYSDGTAEYISHSGEMIHWATTDEESRLLTTEVLRASEPVNKISTVFENHQTPHKNMVCTSILTPGGIRAVETKSAAVQTDPAVASVVNAGKRLMEAMIRRGEKPSQQA